MIIRRRHFWFLPCACVAGAILLIPEEDELAVRVIEDGDYTRAFEIIGGEGERPDGNTIAKLVNEYGSEPTKEKLEHLRFSLSLVDHPEDALNVLQNNDQYFDADQKREFCEVISKRSLADEKPQIALKAYQWLNQSIGLDEQSLQKAILYSRYCTRQSQGIELLKDHMKTSGKGYEEFSESFRAQMISLYREVNRGAEALPYLEKELKMAREKGSTSAAMDYFLQVSLESNKVIESLPVIEKYIQETQVGPMSFDDLKNRKEPHETDTDFLKFGYNHSLHCEWTGDLDKAFDYYAKLAFLGHKPSLNRCFEIFAWLQKQALMRSLLAELDLKNLSFEQVLAYADLEGDVANYSRADEILDGALEFEKADKAGIYTQKGIIALQQDEFELVIDHYKQALSIDPSLHKLVTEIASINNSLGKHERAMECYRSIPLEKFDKDSLENYTMLAASLGEKKDLVAISYYHLHKKKGIKSKDYLDFAERLLIKGDVDEALNLLEKGSEKFPKSARLNLAQIELLVAMKKLDEALALLTKSFREDDSRYYYRAFAIGQKMRDSRAVLSLVGLDDPLGSSWDPTMRVELAQLYQKEGDWQKSIDIWESMDPFAYQIQGLKARRSFARLNFDMAADYQKRFLQNPEVSNSEEWMFMGDIYRRLNLKTESKRAYVLALQTIERDITNELEQSVE